MICEICGQEFKSITASHLKKHWTNMIAYKSIYPNAPLKDTKKISDSLKK